MNSSIYLLNRNGAEPNVKIYWKIFVPFQWCLFILFIVTFAVSVHLTGYKAKMYYPISNSAKQLIDHEQKLFHQIKRLTFTICFQRGNFDKFIIKINKYNKKKIFFFFKFEVGINLGNGYRKIAHLTTICVVVFNLIKCLSLLDHKYY